MFLENLFSPIPSELIVPLAGFTARANPEKLNIISVFFAGVVGLVLGALICYYPSKWLGEERLKSLVWLTNMVNGSLYPAKILLSSKNWFDRQGNKAMLIGKLVPGIRTLISVRCRY